MQKKSQGSGLQHVIVALITGVKREQYTSFEHV